MKSPPVWKLKKMFQSSGSKVTLHKVTEAMINEEGDDEFGDEFAQTQLTEETYTILADIQQVTLEEIEANPGFLKEGDAFGYFLPSYEVDGETVTVEDDDYITFASIKFKVDRTEDFYDAGIHIYRRALLRKEVGK